MRRWLGLGAALAVAAMLGAALSDRFTLLSVLAQAVMLAALFGPMYFAPRRYAEWTRRCRLPGFRRRV